MPKSSLGMPKWNSGTGKQSLVTRKMRLGMHEQSLGMCKQSRIKTSITSLYLNFASRVMTRLRVRLGMPERSPSTPKQSLKKLKMLITSFILSFEHLKKIHITITYSASESAKNVLK